MLPNKRIERAWLHSFPPNTDMNDTNKHDRPKPNRPRMAIVVAFVAAIATAGLVSRSTPDGNLIVTLVPALVVGLTVFGLALWCRGGKDPK